MGTVHLQECPLPGCDRKALRADGYIRHHSPRYGWRETPWCPAGGLSLDSTALGLLIARAEAVGAHQ